MRLTLWIQTAFLFAVGIFITFSQIHNAIIGNLGLMFVALGYATAATIEVLKTKQSGKPNGSPTLQVLIFGAIATAAIVFAASNNITSFLVLVISFAVFNGLLELKKVSVQKESKLSAFIHFGLVAVLAISGALTGLDPVAFVGFFGAYAVILAVHLGITAATPKA
jgi:predicted membrane channel-forming protein YqfA (hemolysin III family)